MSRTGCAISALSRNVRPVRSSVLDVQGRRFATGIVGNTSSVELKVSQDRLMADIHATCEWGKGPRWGTGKHETGMSRLALSDADKECRDWFVHTTKSLGCEVTVDAMGNTFAVRPGRRRGFPPTCAGSHLDTQPTGGRYDGILGVCAGLEMLRVLHEQKIETHFPVGVVNWTNEEGARFPISMVASGVWAGVIPLEKAHNLREVGGNGRTMKQELDRIGYLGEKDAHHQAIPLGAHFELHIEQGPRLQAGNRRIGVVHGVQAYRWHTITVQGQDCHTGTTDFANRSDALLTTARLILHSHRLAVKYDALASTGIIRAIPGSTNTVPGWVQFSLDIRATKDDVLLDLEKHLKSDFDEIIRGNPVNGLNDGPEVMGRPCTIEWTLDAPSRATRFDDGCIDCVRQSAAHLLGTEYKEYIQEMISGAGHDSVFTSRRCPTSMIFVPCLDGLSHNPAEYCAPNDCANGAQVLMDSVLRFDRLRQVNSGE